MSVYVEKYGGYIADNPNIDFERCDGKVFSYNEVNTASVNNTSNSQTITGGQGSYPLAFIDTDKTLEITYESSQFTLDMFQMANATNIVEGDVGTLETSRLDVATGLVITIPYEVQTGSVKINGFDEAATSAAGKFVVAITAATASTDGSTTVTFFAGDVVIGDTIAVSYRRRVVSAKRVVVGTKATTAKGSLYLHWPIYSDGTDCTEAAIKAWLHMYVPRVRVTAMPGFSNSYKSASTNSVTFSAMDPKRADGKSWEIDYEPLGSDGTIVARSSGTVSWN